MIHYAHGVSQHLAHGPELEGTEHDNNPPMAHDGAIRGGRGYLLLEGKAHEAGGPPAIRAGWSNNPYTRASPGL